MLMFRIALAATVLTPAEGPREAEVVRWQADARSLQSDILQNHPRAERHTTKAQWLAATDRLVARAPHLDWPTYVVEMSRLLALAGDGHTNVFPPRMPGPGFDRMYPVQLFAFTDGVYATSADPIYSSLAGARIVTVNGVAAKEALRRASAIAGGDNPLGQMSLASLVLASPGLVRGLGLSGIVDTPLRLTVEDSAGKRDIAVAAIPWSEWSPDRMVDLLATAWTDARIPAPLGKGPNIGLTRLGDGKSLLVTYRAVSNSADTTIEEFAGGLRRELTAGTIERLIVDVRSNQGGNNTLNQALVSAIKGSPVDRHGRLFVLTGRDTFSAAMNFATAMERDTEALFVGEPTGGAPNHSGDPDLIFLPETKFAYRRSTLHWQDSDPADRRTWIFPDIVAPLSFSMIRSGRDPAIEAALAYRGTRLARGRSLDWRRPSQQESWPLAL